MLPNNWKLYFENVKDTYHASLLHLFFTTFRINRLSQHGGVVVEPERRQPRQLLVHRQRSRPSTTTPRMGMRSESEDFTLQDPSLLDNADEFGDGCHAADPHGVPELRAAADPERARGAADAAQGPAARPR